MQKKLIFNSASFDCSGARLLSFFVRFGFRFWIRFRVTFGIICGFGLTVTLFFWGPCRFAKVHWHSLGISAALVDVRCIVNSIDASLHFCFRFCFHHHIIKDNHMQDQIGSYHRASLDGRIGFVRSIGRHEVETMLPIRGGKANREPSHKHLPSFPKSTSQHESVRTGKLREISRRIH